MERQDLQRYFLQKPGASLDYPFEPDVMVFKVMGKMFALMSATDPLSISLKCDPVWAGVLRQTYPAVRPGWFKDHWNSVLVDGSIPDEELLEMVDHSYTQVLKKLNKADRAKLSV